MKVVTGATGHLGNVLVRELLARQEQVRAIVLPTDQASSLADLQIEKVLADVRDLEGLRKAFQGADTVFHLAGIVSVMPGQQELLRQVNVKGTSNVVEACLLSGVRRLVYTSSVHALVEPPHGTALDETFEFDPERVYGDYGKTKAQASLNVLAGTRQGLDAVIACPSGIIGPYDYEPSIVGRLLLNAARGKLRGYVRGGYDFVDVRDVASGLIDLSEKGLKGDTYILSGEFISIKKVTEVVNTLTGKYAFCPQIPFPLALFASRIAERLQLLGASGAHFTQQSLYVLRSNGLISHAKATRELGYSPRSIRQSIKNSLEWFRSAGMLS